MSEYGFVNMHAGAYRGQKQLLEALKLELHVLISFLT